MAFTFVFNAQQIPEAIKSLISIILNNPILFAIILGSYLMYYIYSFVHNKSHDSEVYEVDLLSNGISAFMTGLLLIGLDESASSASGIHLNLAQTEAKIALILFGWGLMLTVFAFIKKLPRFMVVILGNSELALFLDFLAILITEGVTITLTLLIILLVPLTTLLIIQRLRRMMG